MATYRVEVEVRALMTYEIEVGSAADAKAEAAASAEIGETPADFTCLEVVMIRKPEKVGG